MKVAELIYNTVRPKIGRGRLVFNPCVGKGELLRLFFDDWIPTYGMDTEYHGWPGTVEKDYLSFKKGDNPVDFKPALVVMKPAQPEEYLKQTIELFGPKVRIALVAPKKSNVGSKYPPTKTIVLDKTVVLFYNFR